MAKKKKAVSKKKVGKKKAAATKLAKKKVSRKKVTKKSSAKKVSKSGAVSSKKVVKKKAAKLVETVTKKAASKKKVTKSNGTAAAAPKNETKRPARKPSPPRAATMVSQTAPEQDNRPELTEAQLRKVKTGLNKKDLLEYRRMLLEKRAELLGDLDSLSKSASTNNNGDLSHMPMHMADVGSDYYEQEFTLGLVESERKLLQEIDEALLRIANGTYGVCLETGEPIGRLRLDYKPWAKYCIEVVREKERRGEM